ncbi:MAG: LysM peptidoglycan-binding domain-containing protein [Anaerolineaceae bacterium]
MMKKLLTCCGILCALFATLALAVPAQATAPNQQIGYETPTPGADGRIIYIVQDQDTLIRISLLTGVSVDTLRQLNNLKANDSIAVGQELLLATVSPESLTPTVGPAPTATSLLPTPTPFNGTGEICMVLYSDVNGNAIRDDGEPQVAGGAVSLTDRMGKVSLTGATVGGDADPLCFTDLAEGDYNISMGVPQDYNPTTAMSAAIKLTAGDKSTLDFGVQSSSAGQTESGGGRSTLLGIVGGLLLLGGVGLGVYLWRFRR